MATARLSEEENISGSDSHTSSDESDSDGKSDRESDSQKELCRDYNSGGCQRGSSCPYLHVRKKRSLERSPSADVKLTDGRRFQWQLNDGSGWKDIDNNHVIEAQYCLPHRKSIKIYNTPYGAVSIDFNKMRVYEMDLNVRRLDDGNTVWIWYCTLKRKWVQYGDKQDSKGKPSPVKSSDIEEKFQRNPSGSFTFSKGAETFEIKFKEMRQVSLKRKRRVTRRPKYQQQQAGAAASGAAAALSNLTLDARPRWQFKGKGGGWHDFKKREGTQTECSVNSEDIERKYQQNPQGKMPFKVNQNPFELDFRAMIQTNINTKVTHQIRRV